MPPGEAYALGAGDPGLGEVGPMRRFPATAFAFVVHAGVDAVAQPVIWRL